MDFGVDCLSLLSYFLGLDWFLHQLLSFSANVLVLLCDLLVLLSGD